MRKKLIIALVVIFILILCGAAYYVKSNNELLNKSNIAKVMVCEWNKFGKANQVDWKTYTDKYSIIIFKKALKTATKEEGIPSMIEPDYNMKFVFEDGSTREFHLWLKLGKGSLIDVDDTHRLYTLTKESTEALKSIIK